MELEKILKNLTLSMNNKTDKIIKLKKFLDTSNRILLVLLLILLVFLLLFEKLNINLDHYLNYLSSIKGIGSILKLMGYNIVNNIFTSKDIIIYNILNILVVFICISTYITTKLYKKYDSLRKNIIKLIDIEFCKHDQDCTCKDDYIREMNKKHKIDLVFDE